MPTVKPPVRAGDAVPEPPRRPGVDSCGYGVVVVASSTGGPDALSRILPRWNLHVPVLVVQHMPATFTQMLAESLDRCCPMTVAEARDGEIVQPGRVLIAPGNFHLRLRGSADRAEVNLTSEPLVNSLRPAADLTFRDAAAIWGPDVLGVVLTGMGRDGVVGARAIAAAGGMVLAQDEPTSAVWGMPGEVVEAGLATAVLPLDRFVTTVPTLCRGVPPAAVSLPAQAGSVDLTVRTGNRTARSTRQTRLVLLVAAALALVAAAWIGVRGWRNRYDVLGRRRRLPVLSVTVLVVAALALTAPTFLRHRLEGKLAKVASGLVGQPVQVHCQTFGQTFTDLSGDLGYVKYTAAGVPEHRATIMRGPCGDLRHYLDGDFAHPTANEVIAVHVLTHESMHMRGQTDEADAECEAMQRDAETAQLLGATPYEALALARAYWIQDYPNMPDSYRSGECKLGGALDERLPDPPWTTGAYVAVTLPPSG